MKNLHLALIMSLFCTQFIPVVAQSSRSVTGIWGECDSGLLTIRVFSGNGSYTVHSAFTDNCKNPKPKFGTDIGNGIYRVDRQGKVFTTESYYGNSRSYRFVCQPPSSSRMKCQSLTSRHQYLWKKIRD